MIKKKLGNKLKITTAIIIILFFILEGFSSNLYYHKNRTMAHSMSSTVESINWFMSRLFLANRTTKYDRLNELKDEDKDAYPSYSYNPSLHHPSDPYYLSNVPNSHIVFCRESNNLIEFESDEVGFRNPKDQLGNQIDVTILGDSFAEGACESEENTFAGVFRNNGKKIFNLGRGDSGPLFQLATLVEYGEIVDSDVVLWVIFTGNDLQNLRQEKTTKLSNYLDIEFSQNFANKTIQTKDGLADFLKHEFKLEEMRRQKDLRKPLYKNISQEIDSIEFIYKESRLLLQVAQRIHNTTKDNGSRLAIVLINHPRYPNTSNQDAMSKLISDFSLVNNIPLIEFTRVFLNNEPNLYTKRGPHFNANGYKRIGSIIDKWMDAELFVNETVTLEDD